MEIGEFRKQFMEQLRFDAEHEGSAPEAQFISRALELLEDIGDVSDPMPMSIEMKGRRGRIMSFDAYAYDEADGALVMIASDFVNEIDNIPTLTNDKIETFMGQTLVTVTYTQPDALSGFGGCFVDVHITKQ